VEEMKRRKLGTTPHTVGFGVQWVKDYIGDWEAIGNWIVLDSAGYTGRKGGKSLSAAKTR
jgi:hypothetical protein